jgi:hypothetical protein
MMPPCERWRDLPCGNRSGRLLGFGLIPGEPYGEQETFGSRTETTGESASGLDRAEVAAGAGERRAGAATPRAESPPTEEFP